MLDANSRCATWDLTVVSECIGNQTRVGCGPVSGARPRRTGGAVQPRHCDEDSAQGSLLHFAQYLLGTRVSASADHDPYAAVRVGEASNPGSHGGGS